MLGYGACAGVKRSESPVKSQHRGRNAEGPKVGNGIQLNAEIACCSHEAGDPAVQAIQNAAKTDCDRSVIVVPFQRRDNGIVATKDVSYREETRNDRQPGPQSGLGAA